jgi:hypothetical protein
MESTRRWSSYVPPLALMALIFYLSSRSNLDSGLGDWDLVLRKLGHAGVFGTLALLWWRALGRGGRWWAVAITVAYAITDEFHQSFVPNRHGSPVDVLIDSTGALIAVWIVPRLRRRGG